MLRFLPSVCFIVVVGMVSWLPFISTEYETPGPCMLEKVIKRIDHWLEYENKKLDSKLTRLAFHDCVGGCDGCVDLNNMENNGLKSTVDDLNNLTWIIQAHHINMSRADIWALAEMRAISSAMSNDDTKPNFIYKVGRKDCTDGSDSDEFEDEFPNAATNLHGLMESMAQFNFSKRELTALLGAHSIGNCKQQNSGYAGPWATDASRLSNDYYQLLLNASVDWHQVLIKNNGVVGDTGEEVGQKWQWNGTTFPDKLNGSERHIMMLNVDMALVLDIDPNVTVGGQVQCNYSTCPYQYDTYSIVKEFANHRDVWINEFSAVFMKMQEHGYGEGELLEVEAQWGSEWEGWEQYSGDYYMRTRTCIGATGSASCRPTDNLILNQTVHGCCIGELSTKRCTKLSGTYNCTAYDNGEYELENMGGLICYNGYSAEPSDTESSDNSANSVTPTYSYEPSDTASPAKTATPTFYSYDTEPGDSASSDDSANSVTPTSYSYDTDSSTDDRTQDPVEDSEDELLSMAPSLKANKIIFFIFMVFFSCFSMLI